LQLGAFRVAVVVTVGVPGGPGWYSRTTDSTVGFAPRMLRAMVSWVSAEFAGTTNEVGT
jgi:hypothetical protein